MLNSDFDPTATQPEPAMNPMEKAPDLEALADLAEGLAFLTAAGPDAVRVLEGPVEIPAPGNLPARRPSAYGLYGKAPYSLAEQVDCFRTLAILSLK